MADVTDQNQPLLIPRHVAIIMDGNGRWAEERKRPRLFGHKAGVDSVREVVQEASNLGIGFLTLYAFSTENWNRPENEVSGLMGLLKTYLKAELRTMLKNNIRLRCLGDMAQLPRDVQAILDESIHDTAEGGGMVLNLALNYGGRAELIRAIQHLAQKVQQGHMESAAIDEVLLEQHLYTAGQPDPDLLIRTGGEHRLSNFLLWQASYAELYFTDIKWPDFRQEQLHEAIAVFNRRQRRFGKTGAQVVGR